MNCLFSILNILNAPKKIEKPFPFGCKNISICIITQHQHMNCLFSILNAPKKLEKESKQTMLADVTPLSMAPCQQQTNLDHTKTPPQGYLQNNKQIWNS